MKKYIFLSDIHSNIKALKKLKEIPEYLEQDSQVIFLGDYIDGYNQEQNAGMDVINFIKQEVDKNKAIALLGNHDDFLLKTIDGNNDYFNNWMNNGGIETLKAHNIFVTSLNEVKNILLYKYKKQINFIRALPLTFNTKNILAVHAGINWDVPIDKQNRNTMLWIRDRYFYTKEYNDFYRVKIYELMLNDKNNEIKEKMSKLNKNRYHVNTLNKVIVTGHTPTNLVIEDDESPIVTMVHNFKDTPRYLIDGGSKSKEDNVQTHINVLILNEKGEKLNDYKLKG